ncbi:MAG: SH3 domain-containing protein [Planctomycetales bacterium]|nr:SH3 domain-containing protein [Planctomycetales bacterium]
MYSAKMLLCAILLVSLMVPCTATAAPEVAPQVAGKPADVQFPFVAQVTGDNVYLRSGKGQLYYQCGKMSVGDTVTVVEDADGWSKIVPPDGSYSWIAKDYVKISPPGSNKGVVTGENVRVWAGSDFIEASRSDSMQVKLNQNKDQIDDDDFVELLSDQPQNSTFYKIKPPAGAYLWISSEYLKYTGPLVHKTPVTVPLRPDVNDVQPLPPSSETSAPAFKNLTPEGQPAEAAAPDQKPDANEAVKPEPPKPVTKESEYLKQCYALSAKIDEEAQKPLNKQAYADIRTSLEAIKADAEAGKAAAYSQILLERIVRYELAISVTGILNQQDKTLAAAKENIQKTHQAQIDKLPKEVNFIFTGTLKPSHVYTDKTGQKRYLLLDPAGKALCYATASSAETAAKLEQMINTKVGIGGNVINNPKSLVTVVSVTVVEAMP